MVVKSWAPLRISLFGGGTDIPQFYEIYGGATLSFTINIFQEIQLVDSGSPFTYIPPEASESFYDAFYSRVGVYPSSYMQTIDSGIIGGGLGSSASIAVALVNGLHRMKGKYLSRDMIAEYAWDVEVNSAGLFGGKQDQYAASYGGFNLIRYTKDNIDVVELDSEIIEDLTPNFVLVDTLIKRKDKNIQENMKRLNKTKVRSLEEIKNNLYDSLDILDKRDARGLGRLLNETWENKKRSNVVSNSDIDKIYSQGIKNGAYGGKLLGSGGGGCMLFVVDADKRDKFVDKMKLPVIDFSLTRDGVQTRII